MNRDPPFHTIPELAASDPDTPRAAAEALERSGAVLLRQAVDPSWVSRVAGAADRCYAEIDGMPESTAQPSQPNPPRAVRYVASASSIGAEALDEAADMNVVRSLAGHPAVSRTVAQSLGSTLLVDFDQAWLRRQFAPSRAPRGHAPHSWHQDGALGFDFAAGDASSPDALLRMVTCWCPLTPCGTTAPGLEILLARLDRLVPLRNLADARLRSAFDPALFRTPAMEPGDAVLMAGFVLHRTHVRPEMTQDRTSLEVRFFGGSGLPARIAGDRCFGLIVT